MNRCHELMRRTENHLEKFKFLIFQLTRLFFSNSFLFFFSPSNATHNDVDKSCQHFADIPIAMKTRKALYAVHVGAGKRQQHFRNVRRLHWSNLHPFLDQNRPIDCTWLDMFLESSARLDLDRCQLTFEVVGCWQLLQVVFERQCLTMSDHCLILSLKVQVLPLTTSRRSNRVLAQHFEGSWAYVGEWRMQVPPWNG